MSLAQRLDELSQANSEGLLSDDEYRLLRQSAFERYSQNVVVPIEKPVVPTATRNYRDPVTPPRPKPSGDPQKENVHIKLSVTNLIRRATGTRKSSSPSSVPRDNTPLPTGPTLRSSPTNGSRRGLLPRLFQRKPNDLPPLRITPAPSHSSMRSPRTPSPPRPSLNLLSPTRSIRPTPKSPRKTAPNPHLTEDRSLAASKDIQEAVVSLESELLGLIDAFNNLENSAVRRIKKQNARRVPMTTPTSVDVLLEGREWREHRREHRIVPSPSTPIFDSRTQRYHVALEPLSDGISVHSGNSDRTTFSHSRSVSHLAQHAPPPSSPLSQHFRSVSTSLQRKTSVSSISSRSNSFFSSSRVAMSPSSHLSGSSSHLPLHNATHTLPVMVFDEDNTDLEGIEDDADQLSELHEIQRRRNEVITRYTQRIEYLKAKQKGAELHERLLRK